MQEQAWLLLVPTLLPLVELVSDFPVQVLLPILESASVSVFPAQVLLS